MTDFYSDEEEHLITDSLTKGHNSWNEDCLKDIRKKIKEHHMEK